MAFGRLIGQENIKSRLINMAKNRSAQSVLLSGPAGIGKKSFAREYASALLCRKPNSQGACGECDCCRYFEAGTLPDYIVPDSSTKGIKVEDIRTIVVGTVMNLPQISENKVYVIDLNRLNEAGQNAILKSVEEPPKGVFFVLLTTDVSAVLPTILSRTTQIKFSEYSTSEITEILKSKASERSDLDFCSEFSSGIPGRALALIEDDAFEEMRGKTINMLLSLPDLSYSAVLTDSYSVIYENSDSINDILLLLLMTLQDLAVLMKSDKVKIKNSDKRDMLLDFLRKHDYLTMVRIGEATSAIMSFIEEQQLNLNFESSCSAMLIRIYKELKR